MERLTERYENHIRIKGCKTVFDCAERKGAPMSNAIVRLAAYEDIGRTPDEIMALIGAWGAACKAYGFNPTLRKPNAPLTLEELRELYCDYGINQNSPVYVRMKGSWPGSCGANEGYAAVEFGKNGETAKVWTVGWDCPAEVVLSEYGRTWLTYRRRPEERK